MAEPNIETSAAKLVEAAANNDGMTAMRILEEVGSCAWKDVITTANQSQNEITLGTASHLDARTSGETLDLYSLSAKVVPLGSITLARCDVP